MTLIEHLTLVEETRSDINRKHDLVDVMFLVISAIISGAEGRRRSDPKAGKPCCVQQLHVRQNVVELGCVIPNSLWFPFFVYS
ncbi:hypothetical protein D3C78_785390 [compost metagenome]